ncbi:hypothetical protein, partial [Tropheryma whipplei]|uniref:hypothetical protein n=1 Tax=Tropheryma whipplei TaxID=2039 RepID=UPI0005A9F540
VPLQIFALELAADKGFGHLLCVRLYVRVIRVCECMSRQGCTAPTQSSRGFLEGITNALSSIAGSILDQHTTQLIPQSYM